MGRENDPAGNAFAQLTRRQREVARLVAMGLTNREIGKQLNISPNTVRVHIQNIRETLQVHSRVDIAVAVVLTDGPIQDN